MTLQPFIIALSKNASLAVPGPYAEIRMALAATGGRDLDQSLAARLQANIKTIAEYGGIDVDM
jgi:hypothetical protein